MGFGFVSYFRVGFSVILQYCISLIAENFPRNIWISTKPLLISHPIIHSTGVPHVQFCGTVAIINDIMGQLSFSSPAKMDIIKIPSLVRKKSWIIISEIYFFVLFMEFLVVSLSYMKSSFIQDLAFIRYNLCVLICKDCEGLYC